MVDDYKTLIDNFPKKFVGLKQVLRGIIDDKLWCVIVSSDCEEFVYKTIAKELVDKKIQKVSGPSMSELGSLCKIDVGAAVVGLIKDSN